jgi:hypothetical protein
MWLVMKRAKVSALRERGIVILSAAGRVQAILHFAFSFNGQQLGCGHGTFTKGD